MIKRTPLYERHLKAGAKMVEFAGYEMPVQYTGVQDEHLCVRNNVGLFDVSHMGEIWIKGENALDLIQYISTNDASKLNVGNAQYSCMPNGKGGIVDDIIVYRFSDKKYFFVVNASNMEKDWEWINEQNKFNAEIENSSYKISQLALQGPLAQKTLQKLTDANLNLLKYFQFIVTSVSGVNEVIVANTGYTGAGGYEIYVNNEGVGKIWDDLLTEGKEFGIKPCGLASRDTLRLEKGYCLYGNEIDETTSPIEGGLGWIVKFNKQSDFIDKEVLLKQKEKGVTKKLIGFELIDRGIPRHGYQIADLNNSIVGTVTSGTMSPSLNKAIGMGYVDVKFSVNETIINIVIRDKNIKAKVVSLPFLK